MRDNGAVENVGCSVDAGRASFARKGGWFYELVGGHPEWPPQFAYESARLERRVFHGEPVVLGFTTRRGKEALEQVLRFEEQDGLIARNCRSACARLSVHSVMETTPCLPVRFSGSE